MIDVEIVGKCIVSLLLLIGFLQIGIWHIFHRKASPFVKLSVVLLNPSKNTEPREVTTSSKVF